MLPLRLLKYRDESVRYSKEMKRQFSQMKKIYNKLAKGKIEPKGNSDIELIRAIRERLEEGRRLINELREETFLSE